MAGTTDTKKAIIPSGSYILSNSATKTYPWMKQLASGFSADKADMANGQGVILTNGETYVPPDGVAAIGVETLEYMNNKPKEGAHDAIDELMVMNTLKNLKPMYGGGEVKPTSYQDGGMVEDSLMGLMGGGAVKKEMQGYQDGGNVVREVLYDVGRDKDEGSVEYDDDLYKYKRVLSVPADQVGGGEGLRYYFGEGVSDRLQSSKDQAGFDARQKMAFAPQDSIPFDMIKDYLKPEKKGLMKMLGFQEGGPVDDQLGIGMRQANPEILSGQSIGAVNNQAMMLQDSIKQDTVNKAKKSLMLIKLENLLKDKALQEEMGFAPEPLEFQSPIPPNGTPNPMMDRNLSEYLKMQVMSRGVDPVVDAININPMKALR